jgi:hypothetical protein
MGFLTTPVVLALSAAIGAIASYRIYRLWRAVPFMWSKQDGIIYGFHAILLLPWCIKLGTHAFERGDEIYSWNFWAIQHYFLEAIDFSHTGAPYPQLFPKLLAYCYHLVGDIDLQLPVRATLIIFPFAMLTGIAKTFKFQKPIQWGCYLVILAWVLGLTGLERFFNDGYADPVMTSCLVVSAVLFWQSQQSTTLSSRSLLLLNINPFYLAMLSVLCGIAAAHAKQPGLFWAMFSLPLLLWFADKSNQKMDFRFLSVLSIMGGLYWIMGEGQQFHNNQGVMWLSLGERDIFSQLLYAVNKYFYHRPFLFILFAVAVFCSHRHTLLKRMVYLFMIPSMLIWFIFGAYHLRLGQHLIAFAFFVIVASGVLFESRILSWRLWQRMPTIGITQPRPFLLASLVVSMMFSGVLFYRGMWQEKPGISLYLGARHSLQRYFGKDADLIYSTLYSDPQALLWVPSRYLYGLFYKHTKLTTPDYLYFSTYDKQALIQELRTKQPDYVFSVGPEIIDGPASKILTQVVGECPLAFEKMATSQNRFSFVTYKVNKTLLTTDPCLTQQIAAKSAQDIAFNP